MKKLVRKFERVFSYHSGVRITNTSHLAERTIASDTEPIKKRSTVFKPVAPQMIRSAFKVLAKSFVISDFGEPYSITKFTFVNPASSACFL